MEPFWGSLQAALAVAMATTFDDNIYLAGFFSETNRRFRPIHVVAGELMGFSALMAVSLLASRFLAASLPTRFAGWLGVVPIVIGFSNLVLLLRAQAPIDRQPASSEQPMAIEPMGKAFEPDGPSLRHAALDRRSHMVATVAISNGGNNLAIYIPLIANSNPWQVVLTVIVCYGAVLSWLFLAFRLTRLPGVAIVLSRHASRVFPFVLMWLGFRILADSGVLPGS